ncbi:Scr1 family TA system antitoxin-like transcriptional regulator [Nocardia sp. NPDC101769]|uniref:Scr1 family TA system antitoxin-like transcriptional regulator n=1 Tax=Nocardia sp. NPDC101769 TaxID=3364333 RepID=UPI0037F2E3DA
MPHSARFETARTLSKPIEVRSFNPCGHLGSLVGSFALLEFPKLSVTGLVPPPVVFVEGCAGDLYREREGELTRHSNAFTEISRVALDPDTTRRRMLSMAKEFRA